MTENGKEVTSPPSASPAKGNGNTRRRPNRGRGKTLKNTGQDAAAKDRLAVPVPPDKETSEGTVLSTLSAWNEGSKGKKHGRQTRNRNPNSNNAKQEKIPAAPKNDEATKEAEVSVVADPASNSVKEEETVSVHDSNGLESKDTQQASNDEAPISSNEQMQKQKQISLERKRIKRRNQRLRKKQQVANESSTDISPMADSAQAGVEKKSNSGPPTKSKIGMKKKKNLVKNTESLDPVSTFVRPSMRVHVASSHTNDYAKPLRHDDAIIVPEFFGKEDDLSTYEKLVEELDQLQKDQVKGVEWTSWHQGAHMIATNPNESKAFKDIVEKLCQYFHIKEESSFSRLNWYRDSKDWKPFHHDSA